MRNVFLLISLLGLWVVLIVTNLLVIDNYIDLTLKGGIKLLIIAITAVAYSNFFRSTLISDLTLIRVVLWLALLVSLISQGGFDLQSMQQMMIINLVFFIEYYAYVKHESRFVFYVASFVLLVTLKKQLWFSAFILVVITRPKFAKKIILPLIGALIFVSVFGVVGNKEGLTVEKRVSGFLSERFITPDPYGNMRLYLVVTLVPKLVDHNFLVGYGLERYGSIQAYETNRDAESNELGMGEFTGKFYGGESRFNSVMADVGLLTLLMQTGMVGLLYYLIFLNILGCRISTTIKGGVILFPYFLGGPIVYSIGFPILAGIVYSLLHTLERAQSTLIPNHAYPVRFL